MLLTRCTTCSFILPHENDLHSPLSSYFGTYNALNLSAPEKQSVRESIDAIDAGLTSLDDHIARLTRLRYRLRAHRDECKSLLSRTRALPNEILSTIFALCLEQETSPPLNENAPRKRPQLQIRLPLPMAAVCRRWRAVAYSTPPLWNTLKASLGHNTTLAQADALGAWATAFAERSGALPLHIDLQLYDAAGDRPYRALQHTTSHIAAAAALCATAPRWASARIAFSPHSYIYNSLAHLLGASASESGSGAGTLAHLECLALVCTTSYIWGTSASEGPLALALPPTPRLRTAELSAIDPAQVSPGLPWTQLRELSLAKMHWRTVHHALRQCPALVRLHVDVVTDDGTRPLTPPVTVPRTLPHLEFLELTLPDFTPIVLPLRDLVLPALRGLAVNLTTPFVDSNWFAHTQHFLAQSQCTIESLTLRRRMCTTDDPGWATYLSLFPHLTTLVLVETERMAPFSDLLWVLATARYGDVVPRLRILDYTVYDEESVVGARNLAATVVEARRASGTTGPGSGHLESVTLRGPVSGEHSLVHARGGSP